MIKAERAIHSKNSTSQIDEWENDIKNSIKKMYIQNQKDSNLISQYENALQKMKQEYTIVYKENQELKKMLEEKKQNTAPTNDNSRKCSLLRFYENEYDENENVQYIVRKKKENSKKTNYL